MAEVTKYAHSYDVYHWPEFKALCDRLGIPHELRTTDIAIVLELGKAVRVEQHYRGMDVSTIRPEPEEPQPDVVRTTNLHNREWESQEPRNQ